MASTLLLRVEEAAEELRLSRAKVAALVASGDIPSLKVGRSRRISVERLREWVEQQAREGEVSDG